MRTINDDLIFDDVYNIIWQRNISAEAVTWDEALKRARACNLCELGGWRLPKIGDFDSFANFDYDFGRTDFNYKGRGSWFWSSTANNDNISYFDINNRNTGETKKIFNDTAQYILVHDVTEEISRRFNLYEEAYPIDENKEEKIDESEQFEPEDEDLTVTLDSEQSVSEKKSFFHSAIFHFSVGALSFVILFAIIFFAFLNAPSAEKAEMFFQIGKIYQTFENYSRDMYVKLARNGDNEAKLIVEHWDEFKKLDKSGTDFKETLKKAWSGDAESQFKLALIYDNGTLVSENLEEAGKWYEKAGKQGNENAKIIVDNWEEYKTKNSFLRTTLTEALQGESSAQLALGDFFYSGSFVKKDIQKACYFWRNAAENGSELAEAQYKVGTCFEPGMPFFDANDEEKAFNWWLKAANQGYVEAGNKLAECYYYGKCGQKKDVSAAKSKLQKSFQENGNEEARKKLAEWFLENLEWSTGKSKLTRKEAGEYCENLSEEGFSDWRLPTIDELKVLFKVSNQCRVSVKNGCLSKENCFENCNNAQNDELYWSSSEDPFYPGYVWLADKNGGLASLAGEKKNVRCVR